MSAFIRRAASVVLVFGLTWAGTIAYWRQSGSTPGGMEILGMLGLLPAGLLGGGWMVRSMATRAAERAAARIAEGEGEGEPARATPNPAAGDATPAATGLAVLGSALRLPDGLDVPVLLSQPVAAPRPGLHPRLKDHDGLPVFAGYVADLPDPSALPPDHAAAPRLRRAMALLEPVLDELLLQVLQALPSLPEAEERVVAGWRQQRPMAVDRTLSVECLVEPEMHEPLRAALHDWLSQQLADAGVDPRRYAVEVVPAYDANRVWERLQRLADEDAGVPRWHLLLSAYSAIDPDVIERWQLQGKLYRNRHPDGRVPGEAAAGVLLANAAAAPAEAPHARLWRPLRAPVAARASVLQRARLGVQLAGEVLEAIALDAQAVDFVVSDAGAQAEQAAEAGQVAHSLCPDLDIPSQCLSLPASTGAIELASPLALLAIAHARQQQTGGAVLVLGVDHPDSRWATVLHPYSSPETHVRPEQAEAA